MRFYRSERVGKTIREELSKIVIREIEFPEGALATITEVIVDKKLELARVRVSVLPSGAETASLALFVEHAGELQHLLTRKMNIRPMPRIAFELDRGPENAARVEKLLEEEEKGGGEGEGSED